MKRRTHRVSEASHPLFNLQGKNFRPKLSSAFSLRHGKFYRFIRVRLFRFSALCCCCCFCCCCTVAGSIFWVRSLYFRIKHSCVCFLSNEDMFKSEQGVKVNYAFGRYNTYRVILSLRGGVRC